MPDATALLTRLYDRINARDIDAVLALLAEDVAWAYEMTGKHVHGRKAVGEYWMWQWSRVNPRIEPLSFIEASGGLFVVEVHQVVWDLTWQVASDIIVEHVFHLRDGVVVRFDLQGN